MQNSKCWYLREKKYLFFLSFCFYLKQKIEKQKENRMHIDHIVYTVDIERK